MDAIETYISQFPISTQEKLMALRQHILSLVPDATEKISYGMPTVVFHGNLVHFAGYQHHIGFYPGGAVMHYFAEDFAGYKSAKGSVQFPLDKPLPLEKVTKVVAFRVEENLAKKKK